MNLIQSYTFNSFQENMYIISDETHEAIIIDPGCNNAKEEYIVQAYIEKNKLVVKGIYNTHCHIDHILGVNFAKNLFEVPFYAHAFEERNFSAEAKAVIQMWGITCPDIKIDHYIKETDKIMFGNTVLDILFVPGHSPGHLAFYNKKDKYCINGDVLFNMGVGRTDLPGGSYTVLMKSIFEQLFTLPDDTVIYSGHGNSTTIAFERQYNPFLI